MKKTITLFFLIYLAIGQSQSQNPFPIPRKAFDNLYNACNGDQWHYKTWDELQSRTTAPNITITKDMAFFMKGSDMDNYSSVYESVPSINLSNNNISGAIPANFWQESYQEGEKPQTQVYTLPFMTGPFEIILSHNQISDVGSNWGCSEISPYSVIKIDHNQISEFNVDHQQKYTERMGGGIYVGSKIIWLHQNNISFLDRSCFGYDTSVGNYGEENLINRNTEEIRIDNNRLNFENLIRVSDFCKSLELEEKPIHVKYMPQKAIGGTETKVTLPKGTTHTLSFDLPHPDNTYIWELNGKVLPLTAGKNKLPVYVNVASGGLYRCIVKNKNLEGQLKSYNMCVYMEKSNNRAISEFNFSQNTLTTNFPEGAIVGDFSGTDPDGDDIWYRMDDTKAQNGCFRILNGKTLVGAETLFDQEYLSEYKIEVIAYDAFGGETTKTFIIKKEGSNTVTLPSDITLTVDNVNENAANLAFATAMIHNNNGFILNLEDIYDAKKFVLDGNTLKTKEEIDFELNNTQMIRLSAVHESGVKFQKDFIIKINDIKEAPFNVKLIEDMFLAGQKVNSKVSGFLTSDQDAGDNLFSYSLCQGNGDDNNDLFTLVDQYLYANITFGNDDAGSKKIRIRVTDANGLSLEKALIVNVVAEGNANLPPRGLGVTNTVVYPEFNVNDAIATLFMSDPEGEEGNFSCTDEYIDIEGNQVILKKELMAGHKHTVNITASDNINTIEQSITFYCSNTATDVPKMVLKNQKPVFWPNPTSSVLNFAEPGQLKLYDMNGCLLRNQNVTKSIYLDDLKKGMYVIIFETKNKMYREKLSIK